MKYNPTYNSSASLRPQMQSGNFFRLLTRVGLAHFGGQNASDCLNILCYIFKTTWNFHHQSKLASPRYSQLPLLGFHKPSGGTYKSWETKNSKNNGAKMIFASIKMKFFSNISKNTHDISKLVTFMIPWVKLSGNRH